MLFFIANSNCWVEGDASNFAIVLMFVGKHKSCSITSSSAAVAVPYSVQPPSGLWPTGNDKRLLPDLKNNLEINAPKLIKINGFIILVCAVCRRQEGGVHGRWRRFWNNGNTKAGKNFLPELQDTYHADHQFIECNIYLFLVRFPIFTYCKKICYH